MCACAHDLMRGLMRDLMRRDPMWRIDEGAPVEARVLDPRGLRWSQKVKSTTTSLADDDP